MRRSADARVLADVRRKPSKPIGFGRISKSCVQKTYKNPRFRNTDFQRSCVVVVVAVLPPPAS
eukprot:9491110-Pyramimonas_sp.AAC.1